MKSLIQESSDFFTTWKPLRNRFFYFSKKQIFDQCMFQLRKCWGKSVFEIMTQNAKSSLAELFIPQPWHVLLILKWGLIYGDNSQTPKKIFDTSQFSDIYNRVFDLPMFSKTMSLKDPLAWWKMIRASFSNQFYYQLDSFSSFHCLCVLITILNDIGIDYDVNNALLKISDTNFDEFITLQLLIIVGTATQEKLNTYTSQQLFRAVPSLQAKKIESFLNEMSLNYHGLIDFFTTHHKKVSNQEFECSLFSPLHAHPLFKDGDNFHPYHQAISFHQIGYGIYDLLKSYDNTHFPQAFGKGFEEYITLPLKRLPIKYLRENEIRSFAKISSSIKIVDFVLPEMEGLILIEAKSAEMHPSTVYEPDQINLKKKLENSLVSAYKQIFTTSYHIRKFQKENASPLIELYALVVTFKNLLIGTPELIWQEFMYEGLKSELPIDILDINAINPLHIFAISVYELDYLCAYAVETRISITECFKRAIEKNKNPETASLPFAFHFLDRNITIRSTPHIFNKLKETLEKTKLESLALPDKV